MAASEGIDTEVVATTGPGHAAELAAEYVANGYDRIAIWGGDGTINEAAGPIVGSNTALGIIRGGSGDGLSRSLRLPADPFDAVRTALCAEARPVDVGLLGGRHFLNIAGIGFDAEVARRFHRRTRRGIHGYVEEAIGTLFSYRCASYAVSAAGRTFTGPRFVVAFGNGREYGNGFVLTPEARCDDGWLDMVVVEAGSVLGTLWKARRLAFRRMAPAAGVWRGLVKEAVVRGDRLVAHVDGEPFEATGKLEIRIRPGAIRVAGVRG